MAGFLWLPVTWENVLKTLHNMNYSDGYLTIELDYQVISSDSSISIIWASKMFILITYSVSV